MPMTFIQHICPQPPPRQALCKVKWWSLLSGSISTIREADWQTVKIIANCEKCYEDKQRDAIKKKKVEEELGIHCNKKEVYETDG